MLHEYTESERKRNSAKPVRAFKTTVVGRGGTHKHFGGGWESIDTAITRTSDKEKTVDKLLGSLRQRFFDIQAISTETPPNAKLKRTWHREQVQKLMKYELLYRKILEILKDLKGN